LATLMKNCRRAGWMTSKARPATAALSVAIASVLAAGVLFNTCQAASDAPRQLQYRARHSLFGDIGSYTNTIEPTGDTTMIRTSVHLRVTALGVVLHREDAERTERWRGDTLREFHGITTINGVATEVSGKADGKSFIINSPLGRVAAPATIRPSNPWSSDFLNSTTMMLTDTGKVEQVRISGGEAAFVTLNGNSIWTRQYQVDGSLRYKIWIDRQNTPVEFAIGDDSGEISFSLTH
jgi:hypothetical protein